MSVCIDKTCGGLIPNTGPLSLDLFMTRNGSINAYDKSEISCGSYLSN